MTGTRLMVAAVLVVAWAATTAAADAWVVWKRTIGTDHEEWSMQETYLNKPQCGGFGITMALTQDVRHARTHPDYQNFERGADGVSYSFTKTRPDGSGTEAVLVRFVCLPDTLDPREKKE